MEDLRKLQKALGLERHPSDIQVWRRERQIESPWYFEGVYYDYTPAQSTKSIRKESLKHIVQSIKHWRRINTHSLAIKRVLIDLFALRNSQKTFFFLTRNDFLVPLLIEANREIKKHFPESDLYLEVVNDPEAKDKRQLLLYISTKLAPREARPILKKLDNEWWLAALEKAQGKLCISLEYQ